MFDVRRSNLIQFGRRRRRRYIRERAHDNFTPIFAYRAPGFRVFEISWRCPAALVFQMIAKSSVIFRAFKKLDNQSYHIISKKRDTFFLSSLFTAQSFRRKSSENYHVKSDLSSNSVMIVGVDLDEHKRSIVSSGSHANCARQARGLPEHNP